MPFWKYDKVDVRDDVKTQLSDTWKLEVYKTVSGDSGKIYYVQVMEPQISEPSKSLMTIYLCNCPEGNFKAPLSILGLGPQCKHAENLIQFLKERKR